MDVWYGCLTPLLDLWSNKVERYSRHVSPESSLSSISYPLSISIAPNNWFEAPLDTGTWQTMYNIVCTMVLSTGYVTQIGSKPWCNQLNGLPVSITEVKGMEILVSWNKGVNCITIVQCSSCIRCMWAWIIWKTLPVEDIQSIWWVEAHRVFTSRMGISESPQSSELPLPCMNRISRIHDWRRWGLERIPLMIFRSYSS